MNRHAVRLFLAGMAVILGSLACGIGPLATPTAISTPISVSSPTPPPPPLPPTFTPAPVLAPIDTPIPDLATILKNNGFVRAATLDSGCNTPCSAYKNSTLNVLADFYYTNKSFSLLYYSKDKNGPDELAEAALVTKLLAELYPGTLSDDVMSIANNYSNHLGVNSGVTGDYSWYVSIVVAYNADKTVKQATIYIGITPG
jgi:hypothetical protein